LFSCISKDRKVSNVHNLRFFHVWHKRNTETYRNKKFFNKIKFSWTIQTTNCAKEDFSDRQKSAKISLLKTQRPYPGKIKLTKVNCPARSNCLSLVYYLDAQQAVESVLCAGYHTGRLNRTIKFT
jgi:hypothetical protein